MAKFWERRNADSKIKHLQVLLENVNVTKARHTKIALPTFTGYLFVPINDIVRCESDNTYTTFYMANKSKIVVSRTLKECEQMLTEYRFHRVHNSHLVNLDFVTEYIKGEGGQVKMNDGTHVDVSRRRKEEFLSKLKMG